MMCKNVKYELISYGHDMTVWLVGQGKGRRRRYKIEVTN